MAKIKQHTKIIQDSIDELRKNVGDQLIYLDDHEDKDQYKRLEEENERLLEELAMSDSMLEWAGKIDDALCDKIKDIRDKIEHLSWEDGGYEQAMAIARELTALFEKEEWWTK